MENLADRPEFIQALTNTIGRTLRYSSIIKKDMLYVAVPIKIDGNIKYVMRTSIFLRDININLHKLNKKLITLIFGLILQSLIIAIVIARSVSKPISDLATASCKVAAGNFNVKYIQKAITRLEN